MKTALLVIDMKDRFPHPDLPGRIAAHIKASNYDFVGFTLFRNLSGSNWETVLGWHKDKTDEEVVLTSELREIAEPKAIFEKNTYSALEQEELARRLRDQKIEAIDLCGIDTDACVLATAFSAFDKGYKVKILFDLCHSYGNLDEEARKIAFRNLQK